MRLGDLVEGLVGEDRYTAACVWAYSTATDDEFAPWPTDLASVPEVLQQAIWNGVDAPPQERLAAAFELYQAMPCPPNAIALVRHWDELPPADRERLLGNEDERLSAPIAHVMSNGLPAETGRDHPETQ
jgi:hypothetical protein